MIKRQIFFHANCVDGAAAARACYTHYRNATYTPISYGDLIEVNEGINEVWFVDFCPKQPKLQALINDGYNVVVLDHHQTSSWVTALTPRNGLTIIHDQSKSGAMLAWEYVNPEHKPPALIQYVQDWDLWHKRLDYTREVHYALQMDLDNWRTWGLRANEFHEFVEHGKIAVKMVDAMLDGIIQTARVHKEQLRTLTGRTKTLRVAKVNGPVMLASELGERLLKRFPKVGLAWIYSDNQTTQMRHISLRSTIEREDVAKLAEAQGGGGHRNAAGFSVTLNRTD